MSIPLSPRGRFSGTTAASELAGRFKLILNSYAVSENADGGLVEYNKVAYGILSKAMVALSISSLTVKCAEWEYE